MDNIFIERLWRSIKYEEVHLKAYADGRDARNGIGLWMNFYNHHRPHQAMNNQLPRRFYASGQRPPNPSRKKTSPRLAASAYRRLV
jgi:putative transposase